MAPALRIDPEQRFSCSQCGRCCHGFDVAVTAAEIERYRRHDVQAWFGESADSGETISGDPFEASPEWPGLQRIRKRGDGACVFLSSANRCRVHEELGAAAKPLTCRLFPYSFHTAEDAVVVTASFSCPTVLANEGALTGTGPSLIAIETLRKEWAASPQLPAAPLELVTGRAMDVRTARILRDGLLAMLRRDSDDIRHDIARMALALDDLTRPRVLALPDAGFADYVTVMLPHAAMTKDAVPAVKAGKVDRLLQYGFLYMVTSARAVMERRGHSRIAQRLVRLRLLAHFHGLGPGIDRVTVSALKRRTLDINAPELRAIVHNYLRATFATLGAGRRPILDEIAIAFAYLNAACAVAVMHADHQEKPVDRQIFSQALMETSDLAHAPASPLLDWAMTQLAGGTAAMRRLGA